MGRLAESWYLDGRGIKYKFIGEIMAQVEQDLVQ